VTAASGVYPSPKAPATFTARHYDLAKTAVPPNEKVTFQPGSHIPGCHDWHDSKYDVFRNYTPTWRDKNWWITHHRRIVFVFGGWYYWNARYWYPAWGYHSDSFYAYDGPIYAYHDLLPDQVIANVQAALQELGYYLGPVDGIFGLGTREAIANYQRDHGLYTTSTIDEPTLEALGMT
jgi:Putative peptidoglycan binding domain